MVRGGFGVVLPPRAGRALRQHARQPAVLRALQPLLRQCANSPFADGQIQYALGRDNSIFGYPVNPALAIRHRSGDRRGAQPDRRSLGHAAEFQDAVRFCLLVELRYALPRNMVASAGYQGSTSHHLIRIVNQNFLYPNNPAFGPVYFPQPDVNSNYNALNLEPHPHLLRRVSGCRPTTGGRRASISSPMKGPGQRQSDLAPGSADRTRSLGFRRDPLAHDRRPIRAALVSQSRRAGGALLGGFQLSPILTFHTGFPYTVKIGKSRQHARRTDARAGPANHLLRERHLRQLERRFVNGGNWPGGGAGTSMSTRRDPPGIGRNSFRGPRYFSIDLSAAKQFKLSRFRLGGSGPARCAGQFLQPVQQSQPDAVRASSIPESLRIAHSSGGRPSRALPAG